MNAQQYLDKMKEIQTNLLEYIDDEIDPDKDYETFFTNLFTEFRESNEYLVNFLTQTKYLLKLIYNIANNHHRCPLFIERLSTIFRILQPDLVKTFSNDEISSIFANNKMITALLIQENVIDSTNLMNNLNFGQNDMIYENDDYICELIRTDSVEEFIKYVNHANYPLNSNMKESVYETNPFLVGKRPNMLEYSAFFGAINIFNYLYMNNVQLKSTLWLYAIHSNSAEMINLLENLKVKPENGSYFECAVEAVMCNHNKIAQYIQDYLLNENEKQRINNSIFKFNNYEMFPTDIKEIFYYSCLNGCLDVVMIILNTNAIDINCYLIENIFYNEI